MGTTESEIELSVNEEYVLDLLQENFGSEDDQVEEDKLSIAVGGFDSVLVNDLQSSKHEKVDQTLEEAHKILTSMADKIEMRNAEMNQDLEELELRVQLLENKKTTRKRTT